MNTHKTIRPALGLVLLLGATVALQNNAPIARADDHPFAEAHFAVDSLTTARKLISKEDYKITHDNLVDARKHLNLADKGDHRDAALHQINDAIDACEHRRPLICSDHIDKAIEEIQLAMK